MRIQRRALACSLLSSAAVWSSGTYPPLSPEVLFGPSLARRLSSR